MQRVHRGEADELHGVALPWSLKDKAESKKISALERKVTLMRYLLHTVGCRVARASETDAEQDFSEI